MIWAESQLNRDRTRPNSSAVFSGPLIDEPTAPTRFLFAPLTHPIFFKNRMGHPRGFVVSSVLSPQS